MWFSICTVMPRMYSRIPPVLKLSEQLLNIVKSNLKLQHRYQHSHAKSLPQLTDKTTGTVPVFRRAANFPERTALRDGPSSYTYGNIFLSAKQLSNEINKSIGAKTSQRVLFLCPNDANYVITLYAIWMSGQIAVPVSRQHPENLLEHCCKDSNADLLITTREFADKIHKVAKNNNKKIHILDENLQKKATLCNPTKRQDMEGGLSGDFYRKSDAMILYTSGTTSKPKGALLTHKNIISQVTTLIDAWRWTENDTILHTLPLHHVHGIVNALLCPLYIGAKCNMVAQYDSNTIWSHLLGINSTAGDRKISVFMAVPTIYLKLIQEYERVFSADAKMTEYIKTTLKNKVRLMVSGSAPLPTSIYNKWYEITGHRLLERYGMTEIGMGLSQLYDSNREPGYVGVPLPGVTIRLGQKVDECEFEFQTLLECSNKGGKVNVTIDKKLCSDENPTGELLVKSDGVIKEYYSKLPITETSFTIDNFFITGDVCQYFKDKRMFKILGRMTTDIIKTGGYKVSAIEVETHLMEHPNIIECAVVGLKDQTWGEAVAAVLVVKAGSALTLEALRAWCKTKMAEYAVPKVMKTVDILPKNAMGKVNKKELVQALFA